MDTFISIAPNFFGFDFYLFLKGICLGVWTTKSLSIGGSNLTKCNYANLDNQVKHLDALKHYLWSLAQTASTMTKEEKSAV